MAKAGQTWIVSDDKSDLMIRIIGPVVRHTCLVVGQVSSMHVSRNDMGANLCKQTDQIDYSQTGMYHGHCLVNLATTHVIWIVSRRSQRVNTNS
jgi:hypothetical protein